MYMQLGRLLNYCLLNYFIVQCYDNSLVFLGPNFSYVAQFSSLFEAHSVYIFSNILSFKTFQGK